MKQGIVIIKIGVSLLKKIKILLMISLFFNILFVGSGGIDFVKNHVNAASVQKSVAYYFTKKSIFEYSKLQAVDKVFIGDSLTDYGEFHEYYPDEVVLNRGIRNDVAKGVFHRIDEVVSRDAKEAYLMIGVNDIRYATDRKDFEKHIIAIIKSFEGRDTELFIQSILPVNNGLYGNTVSNKKVKQFNGVLQRVAAENGVEYIDLHASFLDERGQLDERFTVDGLHLNGEGYQVWTDTLRKQRKN